MSCQSSGKLIATLFPPMEFETIEFVCPMKLIIETNKQEQFKELVGFAFGFLATNEGRACLTPMLLQIVEQGIPQLSPQMLDELKEELRQLEERIGKPLDQKILNLLPAP